MYTALPDSYRIDFDRYFEEYKKQPDAIRSIPSEEELVELAHKTIVKGQLTLAPLPEGEAALQGDTAVIRVRSKLPRFNKEKVTVTLGRGLYSRELEEALIGRKAGEAVSLCIQDQEVTAEIRELKRKAVPEPTDEMVAALGAKDNSGKQLLTVREYEAFVCREKTMSLLAAVNYFVVSKMLEDLPPLACNEDDIRILGELERDYFIRLFQETEGIDIRENIPETWKQGNIETLDDFIAARREWYTVKISQCLLFSNILGIPCEGTNDPLDHYEVLSELQLKMFDLILSKLKGEEK